VPGFKAGTPTRRVSAKGYRLNSLIYIHQRDFTPRSKIQQRDLIPPPRSILLQPDPILHCIHVYSMGLKKNHALELNSSEARMRLLDEKTGHRKFRHTPINGTRFVKTSPYGNAECAT
jgi:hypothetical protein